MRHLFPGLLVPILFIVLIVAAAARAQDPVAVDPTIAKVEFENDRIRVLRVHYGPHQKLAMHEHPAKVAVCLTNFHMHRVDGGTSSEATCPAGSVTWREPEKHAVENLDDSPAETVEVELKYARTPAATAPVGRDIPIDAHLEPHYHVLFENQYVKVMDVRIDPGDTTAYHTHFHDDVFIRLTSSQTQSQLRSATKEEAWGPIRTTKPGEVAFEDGSVHPFTHHLKNVGTTAYRVLVVELLP